MNILITGVPATGKSEISKALGKLINHKVINDKNFCKKNNLGDYKVIDSSKEYVVNIKALNTLFKIENKENKIFEGHLWCELSKSNLKSFDYVFLLVASKKLLLERQKKRKYPDIKIIENIFCQDVKYLDDVFNKKEKEYITIKVTNDLESNLKKIMVKLKWQKH